MITSPTHPTAMAAPQPHHGEVLIKVKAAGLNGTDLLQLSQANYPLVSTKQFLTRRRAEVNTDYIRAKVNLLPGSTPQERERIIASIGVCAGLLPARQQSVHLSAQKRHEIQFWLKQRTLSGSSCQNRHNRMTIPYSQFVNGILCARQDLRLALLYKWQ